MGENQVNQLFEQPVQNEKAKKNTGLIITLIAIILFLLGLVIYLLLNNQTKNEQVNPNYQEEEKNESDEKIETKMDLDVLGRKLHSRLIGGGNLEIDGKIVPGFYQNKKVTKEDVNPIVLYGASITYVNYNEDGSSTIKINPAYVDVTEEYLSESLENTKERISFIYCNGFGAITREGENWILEGCTVSNPADSETIHDLSGKYDRTTQDGDYIYVYDKYSVAAFDSEGLLPSESKYYLSKSYADDNKEKELGNFITVCFNENDEKKLNELDLNLQDYLYDEELCIKQGNIYSQAYKHTFKKNSNGEYYWVSSEPTDF